MCDIKLYPRDEKPNARCIITCCPYFLTQHAFNNCMIGCDKPGVGSPAYNPSNNDCCSIRIILFSCNYAFDLLCYIPMCFNCFTITDD